MGMLGRVAQTAGLRKQAFRSSAGRAWRSAGPGVGSGRDPLLCRWSPGAQQGCTWNAWLACWPSWTPACRHLSLLLTGKGSANRVASHCPKPDSGARGGSRGQARDGGGEVPPLQLLPAWLCTVSPEAGSGPPLQRNWGGAERLCCPLNAQARIARAVLSRGWGVGAGVCVREHEGRPGRGDRWHHHQQGFPAQALPCSALLRKQRPASGFYGQRGLRLLTGRA